MEPYALCAATVREHDRDRYIADLFAPEDKRRHLFALHAFNAEVARIGELVSEPALGEIRLAWWREALAAGGSGHPVAAALSVTIDAVGLPRDAVTALLDARSFDVYDEPMPTLADLERYADRTASALFRLGATALTGEDTDAVAEAASPGGIAYTLTAAMAALSARPARAGLFIPDDLVAAHALDRASLAARRTTPELRVLLGELIAIARRHLAAAIHATEDLPAAARPAFLPLALVGPTLDRMARPGLDPLSSKTTLSPWRRQWLLWRASRGLWF